MKNKIFNSGNVFLRLGLWMCCCFCCVTMLHAQTRVGIGTTTPHPSALLDVSGTNGGILLPRMTRTQRENISNPAAGLIVYESDIYRGIYYYDGNSWMWLWPELRRVVESGKEGWRLNWAYPDEFGDIGNRAIDFSFGEGFSTTRGATGAFSMAWGISNTASGTLSTSWGYNSFSSGENSTVFGQNSRAIGFGSTAWGLGNEARGRLATAWGGGTTQAIGELSTTWGFNAVATEIYSTAFGQNSGAYGRASTAWGSYTNASGDYSSGWGTGNKATGLRSTVWGRDNEASGINTTAWGQESSAIGELSTAFGLGTISRAYASISLGQYNNFILASNPNSWVATDPVLIVGNGTSAQNRQNAFILRKNGNLTISGSLTQNSDARLKKDISPITDPLETLHQIGGYRYHWKSDDRDNKMHYGLLAQQVQEVAPHLVSADEEGTLSVNYIELIPLLLEGMKAQQKRIEELERKINKYESKIGHQEP
jgi:hypothetical protein